MRALASVLLLSSSLAADGASLRDTPRARSARVARLVGAVDPARLHATVARLVSFGTRHTLSDTKSDSRGIGAARRWLAGEFRALSHQQGSRLQPFDDRFTAAPGPRVARPTEIWNVGAIVPGTDAARAKEAIVVTGHYDSRASDVMDATSDAPGAVDDGSGVALVLELARVLAAEQPAVSVYLIAVAGEEQGLIGSTHLARRLRSEGVTVLAMTSIDIAGNTEGQDGVKDNVSARLFSEGVRSGETDSERQVREALGAENDAPAREWARYVKRVGERYVNALDLWVMLRRDRIGRGSDHMAFAKEGYPAIRLSEAHEHYDRQHQDVRVEDGRAYGDDLAHFDAGYAAQLTRAMVAAVAHLAGAPAPLREVALGGAVSPDTTLRSAARHDPRTTALVVYTRRADAVAWQRATVHAVTDRLVLRDVPPDNEVFAVATVDAEGNESLPTHPTRLE